MKLRTSIKVALCLVLFALLAKSLQAQCDCRPTVYVIKYQENNLYKCRHILSKAELGLSNCADSYLVVLDTKINGDTIDKPGNFSYNLYAKDGTLLCSGAVSLLPTQPVLDSTQFIENPIPFTLQYRLPSPLSTGLLTDPASPAAYPLRYDSESKLPAFVPDTIANLGIPFYSYHCATVPCSLSLDFVDYYNIEPCDLLNTERYASLRRRWLVHGCTEVNGYIDQNVFISRPTRADLHWSFSPLRSKSVELYYSQAKPDFGAIQINDIIPVIGKENVLIGREQTNLAVNVQDQRDTLADGIHFSRTFFIYDNCKQQALDTFKLKFSPKSTARPWLGNVPESITFTPDPAVCNTKISSTDVQKMLQTLQLNYNPTCRPLHFSWKIQRRVERENYFPFLTPNASGDYELHSGDYRIYFTSLDSCGHFGFQFMDILIRVPTNDLNAQCGPAFNLKLNSTSPSGKRIEYITGLAGNFQRQACGIYYTGTRRIVEAKCLDEFRFFFDYDLDGDGNVLEHFELIRSGPFARMYYTPWRHYIYALEYDEGKPVYYQSYVQEIGGNADTCLGYINILPKNTNRISVNLAVEKAIALKNTKTCLPIKTSSINNLTGIQLIVKFDPTMLKFEAVNIPASSPITPLYATPGQGHNPLNQFIYLWTYNGKNTVNLVTQTTLAELCFTPLKLGKSAVWIDSLNGLEIVDIKESNFIIKTSIGEIEAIEKIQYSPSNNSTASAIDAERQIPDIRVFPNPVSDQIFVVLPTTVQPIGKLRLKNLYGQILLEQQLHSKETILDVQQLIPGIHFVEVQVGEKRWTKKIMILRH